MWIMTTGGFLSVVAKGGKDVLMVRARDLDSLRPYVLATGRSMSEVTTGKGTDYPHRLRSNSYELGRFLLAEVEWVQYSNFKDEAKLSRGEKFANFLSKVWQAGLALEDVEYNKWAPVWDDEKDISPEVLTEKSNLGYDTKKKTRKKSRNRRKGNRHEGFYHRR